jgi:hypothetical protein
MFIYYSRRYLLGQGLELAIFEVQGHGLLELEHLFGACPHIPDALDSPSLWGLCKDIDMVGLCGLLPLGGFQIDVVFGHVCIIPSIYLDVNDFSTTEHEIEIHVAVIDPDAVVAPGHGVVGDLRVMLGHIVLNQDDLQWVQLRVD